jgi:hypothetical protein
VRVFCRLEKNEEDLPLCVLAEDAKVVYFGASTGAIDMSLFAILLFVGTMVLSLWATMRVRQVYGKFSQLPQVPVTFSQSREAPPSSERVRAGEGVYAESIPARVT